MNRFLLAPDHAAQIKTAARAAFPGECCGLIEGARTSDAIRATNVHSTRNVSTEAGRFEIDPAEHIRRLRAARAAGREIIGCYHSHPNGRPDLSDRDREQAGEEGFVWLIASLAAADAPVRLRTFIVANERFEPLAFEVAPVTGSSAGKDASQ